MKIKSPFLSGKYTGLSHKNWFHWLLVVLLTIGIFFHFFNIDKKLYWHDESYTSIRAAGYTRIELDDGLFQDRIMPARELQNFQNIKPGSTFKDTLNSLALEDPQHPPIYFLAARFWMKLFGNSTLASRMLPVLISLISLPFIYFLAIELFSSRLTAIVATILLALSPFDILFAQTARQYSLLTLATIASSFFLLKALKNSQRNNWRLYAIACAIGYYTHPFFGLTAFGHGIFLCIYWFSDKIEIKKIWSYLIATVYSWLLYVPWIIVLVINFQRALATTDWAHMKVEFLYLVKLWTLSFTSLFIDIDLGFDNIQNYLIRLPLVALMFVSFYLVCRQTKRETWLFVLTSVFVPFLLLVSADLILGGKRSAVTRYLIPCFPGVQLAVAYFLSQLLLSGKQLGRAIFATVITIALVSCTINGLYDTSWSKDLSYHNADITRIVNASTSPLLICDRGDDWTNLGDLLSLSYLFNDDVRVLLLNYPANRAKLEAILAQLTQRPSSQEGRPLAANKSDVFIFRPTGFLLSSLEKSKYHFNLFFPEGKLFKLSDR